MARQRPFDRVVLARDASHSAIQPGTQLPRELKSAQKSVCLCVTCFVLIHRPLALMSNHRVPHSAQVSMVLHLEGGQDVRLSQMGPDFIILREALTEAAPPQDASRVLGTQGD